MPKLIFNSLANAMYSRLALNTETQLTHQAVNTNAKGWAMTTSKITGKHYYEVRVDELNFVDTSAFGIGVIGGGDLLGDASNDGLTIAQGPTEIFFYENGTHKGSWTGHTIVNGSIVGCAVDKAANLVWFAHNGTWLNGDPSTGTGGYSYNLTDKYFAAGLLIQNVTPLRACTGLFAAASQTYAAPTGFSTFEGALTNTVLSTAGGDQVFESINRYARALETHYWSTGSTRSLIDNAGGRFALSASGDIDEVAYVDAPNLIDYTTNAFHDVTTREVLNGETVDTTHRIYIRETYDAISAESAIQIYKGPSAVRPDSYSYSVATLSEIFEAGFHIMALYSEGGGGVEPVVTLDGAVLTPLATTWAATSWSGWAVFSFTVTAGSHTIEVTRGNSSTKFTTFSTIRVVGSTEVLSNITVDANDSGGSSTKDTDLVQYPVFGGLTVAVGTIDPASAPWTLWGGTQGPLANSGGPANSYEEEKFLTFLAEDSPAQIRLTGTKSLGGFRFIHFTLAPTVTPPGGNVLFDYNQKYTHIHLRDSARGLYAPAVNVGAEGWCFTNKQLAAGEKIYVEFHPILDRVGAYGVGGRTDFIGGLSDGLHFSNNGYIYRDGTGVNPGSIGVYGTAKVGMALDVDAGLTYFSADGVWNSYTGTPGSGTGVSYALLGKWIGAALMISNGGPIRKLTGAFTANRLTYALPEGYTAADGTTLASGGATRTKSGNTFWI